MHLLQEGGELNGSVTLSHPVQIESEDRRFQAAKQLSDIKLRMHEHERGDIHDFRVESVICEMLLDREPADRIHLVDRGDINAVAVAQISEQHIVTLTEVVDAGSMQQKEV